MAYDTSPVPIHTPDGIVMHRLFTDLWLPRMGLDWLNENVERSWPLQYRIRKEWANLTMAMVKQPLMPHAPWPKALIQPVFKFKTARRRDPINFMPTVKPIIDQLVRMGYWRDDTPEFVDYGTPSAVEQVKEDGVHLFIYERKQ